MEIISDFLLCMLEGIVREDEENLIQMGFLIILSFTTEKDRVLVIDLAPIWVSIEIGVEFDLIIDKLPIIKILVDDLMITTLQWRSVDD